MGEGKLKLKVISSLDLGPWLYPPTQRTSGSMLALGALLGSIALA